MSNEERQSDEDQQQVREEDSTESGRLRGTFLSARQAFGKSFDQLTGAEFRRQFEEFSNVVTTTVLGIHRDHSELNDRLERIEQTHPSSRPANKMVKVTFLLSLVAVIISVAALFRTI